MKHLLILLLALICAPGWAQLPRPLDPEFTVSELPIVIIDTHQQAIVDDPKIGADMGIIDNGPGQLNKVSDTYNNYNGRIGIELRGSSSQDFPKKSYGFETRDSKNADLDASLLGMPTGNDWILSASYSDKTLLRNVLTYSLARATGSYASRTRHCEVVLNGVYQGVYVLMEKIKRGADRVNISKLKASDQTGDAVTGGYILKVDKTTGTPNAKWVSKFKNPSDPTENNVVYQVEYPKLVDINAAQLTYIQAYVDSFETALGSRAATVNRGYQHFINSASFVDYFLLTELSRNVDGYTYSTYFYKDRTSKGGKLTMGPLWDYDIAWANANYCDGDSASGWVYQHNHCDHAVPFWWRALLADPAFMQAVQVRWAELRASVLREEALTQQLDAYAVQLANSQARNFTAWPILGVYVWPNAAVLATHQQEVDYLKQWLHKRLKWMDASLTPSKLDGIVTSTQAAAEVGSATVAPLPFATSFTVTYSLPSTSPVTLGLVDAVGKLVYQQALGSQSAGPHVATITECGNLPPGLYFLRLTFAAGTHTLRVVHTAL